MATKIFNLSLPAELVKLLDRHTKNEFSTRSEFIKKAVINQLKTEMAVKSVLDKANKKGKKLRLKSESDAFDLIND